MISVIIPVYNAKESLEKCVESVMAQDYEHFEIILVDDGSTDGSREICDQLAEKYSAFQRHAHISQDVSSLRLNDGCKEFSRDSRSIIKVLHTPNGGVSHARNNGLSEADGEWITFVDADDTVEKDYLSQLYDVITNNAIDNDHEKTDFKTVEQTVLVTMTDRITESVPFSGFNYVEHALLHADSHVWGKLFNKAAVDEILGQNWFPDGLTIGEDMLMLLQLALGIGSEHRIRATHTGAYNYVINEQGAMLREYKPSYLDQITCWQQAEELLEPYKGHISDYIYTRLAVIQIMTALLVAGKIAQTVQNDQTEDAIRQIRAVIRHATKRNGAYAGLSSGYKIKTMLFLFSPKLYLSMYGKWKG